MTGTLKRWGGAAIAPTGRSFEVDFYTVAFWDDGQVVEENLSTTSSCSCSSSG
jgi:hypothetical protein